MAETARGFGSSQPTRASSGENAQETLAGDLEKGERDPKIPELKTGFLAMKHSGRSKFERRMDSLRWAEEYQRRADERRWFQGSYRAAKLRTALESWINSNAPMTIGTYDED